MKRILAILLVLCCILPFTACVRLVVVEQDDSSSTTEPTTIPTTQPDPCANGHTFEDGVCVNCQEPDPNYDPCANGHTFEDGVCVHCQEPDPNYDPCANGHTFEDGVCVHCQEPDPSATTAPTTAPTTKATTKPTTEATTKATTKPTTKKPTTKKPTTKATTAHVHVYSEATCTKAATCSCGAKKGKALGHAWVDATCQAAKHCSRCNKVSGSALDHEWSDATCLAPKTCVSCGTTTGSKAGHSWEDANSSPRHCTVCDIYTGVLSGKICKASDRITAIQDASIKVYKNGTRYASRTSNASGNYTIDLPAGDYLVVISSDGYIEFKAYASVNQNENKYLETFLLIEGSETETGIASGKVINSLTGVGAPGVSLVIKKNWNNVGISGESVATTTTDTDGSYSVELPLGNYTVNITKDGYTDSSFNIIVQSGTTNNQIGTITPEISGDNYLITLTWGENPRDLDSHVVGTLSSGSTFHVYFSHKSQYDGDVEVCNLDYDDITSYGPEHITLNTTNDTPYYYYIYRFAGSGTVGNSEAKITVEQGNALIAQFNVPTDLGDADYWNVFAIKNGELIICNTITVSPDLDYAG